MPQTLYDADGNPVEDVYTADEVAEYKATTEKMESEIKEKEEELKKFTNKEFNFSQLRKASKEEKEKLLKKFSEKEKAMIDEMMSLREDVEGREAKLKENQEKTINEFSNAVLDQLAGDDDELREKLKETAKEFVGTPETFKDVESRFRKAYTLVKGQRTNLNPLNTYTPGVPPKSSNQSKNYVDTPEGRANFARWFPNSKLAQEERQKKQNN